MKPIIPREPGYKEVLCKWETEKGKCKWGPECKFAHNEKELRKGPPQKPGMYDSLCRRWVEKNCLYGINCSYQHVIPNQKPDWKVVLCKTVGSSEKCKFEDRCNFAHSDKERRTIYENQEYMTMCHRILEKTVNQSGGLTENGNTDMIGGNTNMMAGNANMMVGNANMMAGNANMMAGSNMMGGSMDDSMY